jgi:hypothetical protein
MHPLFFLNFVSDFFFSLYLLPHIWRHKYILFHIFILAFNFEFDLTSRGTTINHDL